MSEETSEKGKTSQPSATAPRMQGVVLLPGDALGETAEGRPVLIGGCCAHCDTEMFPRYPVCPVCMGESIAKQEMPRNGTLYSYTVLHVGLKKWHKPLALGYVDLPNGVRVFSHLRGTSFQLGDSVELDVAEVGVEADGASIRTFVFKRRED